MAPSFTLRRGSRAPESTTSAPPSPLPLSSRRNVVEPGSHPSAPSSSNIKPVSDIPLVSKFTSAPSTPTRPRLDSAPQPAREGYQLDRIICRAAPSVDSNGFTINPGNTPRLRPRGASLATNVRDRRNAGWFSLNSATHRPLGESDRAELDDKAVREEDEPVHSAGMVIGMDDEGKTRPSGKQKTPGTSYFSSLRRSSRNGSSDTSASGSSGTRAGTTKSSACIISSPTVEDTRKASKEEIMHDLFLLNGRKAADALGWAVREESFASGSRHVNVADGVTVGLGLPDVEGDEGRSAASLTPDSETPIWTPSESHEGAQLSDSTTQCHTVPDIMELDRSGGLAEFGCGEVTVQKHGPTPSTYSSLSYSASMRHHRRLCSDVTGVAMLGESRSQSLGREAGALPSDIGSRSMGPPAMSTATKDRTTMDLRKHDPGRSGSTADVGVGRVSTFALYGSALAVDEEDEDLDTPEEVVEIISARRESMQRSASASRSRDANLAQTILADGALLGSREVICRPIDSTCEDEIRWEVVIRRKEQHTSGPRSRPGGAVDLAGSGPTRSDIPPSATSLNLSLSLDKPAGKLVFVSLPTSSNAAFRSRAGSASRSGPSHDPFASTYGPAPSSPLRPRFSPNRPSFPTYTSISAATLHGATAQMPISPKSLNAGFEVTSYHQDEFTGLKSASNLHETPPPSPKDMTRVHRKTSIQAGIFVLPGLDRL